MHNQKWDISDAQSSTDLHGCLVLDAVASTLDARASTADGLDAAASTHGLDAWPRRLDASGAWSHSTPPLDTSTLARRYSLNVCSTLGSTQARRLDARAQFMCGRRALAVWSWARARSISATNVGARWKVITITRKRAQHSQLHKSFMTTNRGLMRELAPDAESTGYSLRSKIITLPN